MNNSLIKKNTKKLKKNMKNIWSNKKIKSQVN